METNNIRRIRGQTKLLNKVKHYIEQNQNELGRISETVLGRSFSSLLVIAHIMYIWVFLVQR